ncbi:MAG: hypothetical protein WC718_12985 [Phycisphaerales bacterium]|jgi:hypothetical protein
MAASGAKSPDAPTEPVSGTTGDAPIQHADEQFREGRAHARFAPGKRGREEEHGRADDIIWERRTHAGGVRADEVGLECREIAIADALLGEGAEPGVDAVVRLAVGE